MPEPPTHAFSLVLAHDGVQTRIAAVTPFTIGRSRQMDLVLPYPYISRQQAIIQFEPGNGNLLLTCHGRECFVNGAPATQHALQPGDEIRLGSEQGPLLRVEDDVPEVSSLRVALGHLKESTGAEITKLGWFIEAARRLNTGEAVQQILAALIETTLELTRVERGYVFLRTDQGALRLASGRNGKGETLEDDSTISHSAIGQAVASGSDFIVTDTLSAEAQEPSESIVEQSIRAVICIPLRRHGVAQGSVEADILGVLYLDSRVQSSRLTRLDSELLRTIAAEASLLVEHAALAETELQARRYREELSLASEIQQNLMSIRIPKLPFAEVDAQSVPCAGIGGDFYDALCHDDALYVVLADISGKGVSAAVLGCTLQGLIHGQILGGLSLAEIAAFANQYICHKKIHKYATLLLLRLAADGTAEYINCGHVQPLLHVPNLPMKADAGEVQASVQTLRNCNLPVGLFAESVYEVERFQLQSGQRLFLITDGLTEAQNPDGQCFGEGLLQTMIGDGAALSDILTAVTNFTAGAAPEDDCTAVEVRFR